MISVKAFAHLGKWLPLLGYAGCPCWEAHRASVLGASVSWMESDGQFQRRDAVTPSCRAPDPGHGLLIPQQPGAPVGQAVCTSWALL